MTGLRAVVIVTVLMAFILAVVGDSNKRPHARHAGGGRRSYGYGHHRPCTTDPEMYQYFPPCSPSKTPITGTESSATSTTEDSSEEDSSEEKVPTTSTSSSSESTKVELTSLERAHWCRFSNGTYVPLGYSFMRTACSLCQCTNSRALRCQLIQCMPTYCVDNTMPHRKAGQCCTQCGYEVATNSCVYNGISFSHGAIMKMEEDKMQCWCQLGNIECRKYMGSLFQGVDIMADGAAIYIIVIILSIVLIFGLLLCCGCTLFFYYYYKRNQHTFQLAYDQYINSAGWQPVEEDEENIVDTSAEEKRMEAEKYQFTDSADDVMPPSYANYNGSYVPEQEQKQI